MSGETREKPSPPPELERMVHSQLAEEVRAAAMDRRMTEDLALTLLTRRDLQGIVLEELSRNMTVMKHRKVIVGLVCHPRTPRYVSLPITRRLYTFELMKIALLPPVPTDVKVLAEEAIMGRLGTISSGERLALAKQGSTRIASALLADSEARITDSALMNSRLTEPNVVKALMREDAPEHLVDAVCRHHKWSLRKEVQIALLKNQHTPVGRAVYFAGTLSTVTLREVLANARLKIEVKEFVEEELARRKLNLARPDDRTL
jgi:phosphoribosylanthranilate isomerase